MFMWNAEESILFSRICLLVYCIKVINIFHTSANFSKIAAFKFKENSMCNQNSTSISIFEYPADPYLQDIW